MGGCQNALFLCGMPSAVIGPVVALITWQKERTRKMEKIGCAMDVALRANETATTLTQNELPVGNKAARASIQSAWHAEIKMASANTQKRLHEEIGTEPVSTQRKWRAVKDTLKQF
jgi:hypothetical protein